jgi:hypothetical protein
MYLLLRCRRTGVLDSRVLGLRWILCMRSTRWLQDNQLMVLYRTLWLCNNILLLLIKYYALIQSNVWSRCTCDSRPGYMYSLHSVLSLKPGVTPIFEAFSQKRWIPQSSQDLVPTYVYRQSTLLGINNNNVEKSDTSKYSKRKRHGNTMHDKTIMEHIV